MENKRGSNLNFSYSDALVVLGYLATTAGFWLAWGASAGLLWAGGLAILAGLLTAKGGGRTGT